MIATYYQMLAMSAPQISFGTTKGAVNISVSMPAEVTPEQLAELEKNEEWQTCVKMGIIKLSEPEKPPEVVLIPETQPDPTPTPTKTTTSVKK